MLVPMLFKRARPVKFADLDGSLITYGNRFRVEGSCITIGADQEQIELVLKLLLRFRQPPFRVTWEHRVSRTTGVDEGLYTLDGIRNVDEVRGFLEEFRDSFEGDARHVVRLYAHTGRTEIVYDEHNLILLEGGIEGVPEYLRELGFDDGLGEMPYPHVHKYHDRFDKAPLAMKKYAQWVYAPLPDDSEV